MKTNNNIVRTGTKVGAALGGLSFLIIGIVPGFYFGSFGALVVMKHLLGASMGPSVLVRMVVAIASMLGIVCVASVHLVVGSIVGTACGYMAKAIMEKAEVKETAGTEVKAHS